MVGRTVAVLAACMVIAAACSSDPEVTDSTSRPADETTTELGGSGDRVGTTDGSVTTPPGSTETGATIPSTDDPLTPFEPAPLEWDDLTDEVDVALLDVPVDYADPGGDQFELYIARHRAVDPEARIGSLLVNPGGPGFGGSNFAVFAPQIFDSGILRRFDIIGWDPRGTGDSEPPIDCIDDYDPYFTALDSTPDSEQARVAMVDIARSFAQACVDHNAPIIDHVGTNDSARDMDTIRRALGEDRISYFGFSYGSELGATWATLFPDTVRAAVLDGASDPNADALESSLQQMRGFEASLETFLDQCSADESCAFHSDGDARGAFVELMNDLDAHPLTVDPDRPPVNRDVATVATAQAMYSEDFWPALERSLASARAGDGAGLLALNDAYYQRQPDGTYGNELEAFQVISCADTAERPTVTETDAETPLFVEAAPLLVPEGSIGSYFCTFFPPAADPRIEITGVGAGPIVVIGTTGDPATPFDSTVRMADTLEDGRLVVVEADQHTGYGVNSCIVDVVNRYLADLEPPDYGTQCR